MCISEETRKKRNRKAREARKVGVRKPPVRQIVCVHCKSRAAHKFTGLQYPNGNRRMICAACHRPFIDKTNQGKG